jgi:G:T/U-mismatch repair DNA glycosylase
MKLCNKYVNKKSSMLKEILIQNLRVVFVGTTVAEISDELGFYYLTPKNRFWEMLEYANITPTIVISQ